MPPPSRPPSPNQLLARLTTDHPPTASSLHTPKVLAPLIVGAIILTALFILAIRHWLWQDDAKTLEDIEAAVRRRRSNTVISGIDVEACRGALSNAVHSGGGVIKSPAPGRRSYDRGLRSPSPIREESADEMVDVELRNVGGGGGLGMGRIWLR